MSVQFQQHPASVDAYIRHGWSLVPIPPGTKGPVIEGWNKPEASLASQSSLPTGYGIGLAHAFSGTMALDIDNWQVAAQILQGHQIDIAALYAAPDAVIIDSGRGNRGKLLYRMPEGYILPTKKVIRDKETIYEFRCATSTMLTVQDVLPPSIHPDTHQPYRWAGLGHWTRLPTIPDAVLALWEPMVEAEKKVIIPVANSVNASWNEIKQAVEHIDPSCSHDPWLTVGMALHWAGSHTEQLDEALSLWNDWSKGSDKYPGEKELLQRWRSFRSDKANSVKLGSLFHIAKTYGWTRPEPDVSHLFGATISPTQLVRHWRPLPPEMDMSLWPKVLATRAMQVSESVGCDPLVPLWAGLAAVCGLVDARIRLQLTDGFEVPPVLWLMTLGDPADKKSPGSRPMMTILKDIEFEDRPRYEQERLAWEGQEASYAAAKKQFLDWSASSDALLGATAPHVPNLPAQPVPLKITVSDITSQKLVRDAAPRPRGLLCYLDEMNAWVRKLTDKSSFEDRSAWVVSYESQSYTMDRVGAGNTFAENLAVSIYGNIQPTVFRQNLSSLAADGLLQRFLPAILNGDKTRRGEPVSNPNHGDWENLLRLTFALPVQTYQLSFPAYVAFRDFQLWYEDAKKEERMRQSGDVFMTAFGKLEGTTGRLILLFHIMEQPFAPYVDVSVVERVVEVVKGYLIPAFRFTFGEVGSNGSFDQWIADYIIQHSDKSTITLSELKRGARRQLEAANVNTFTADQWIYNAMHNLELAQWVIRMDDGSGENRHLATWAINPSILDQYKDYRKKVIASKQKLMDEIYSRQPVRVPRTIVYGNDED